MKDPGDAELKGKIEQLAIAVSSMFWIFFEQAKERGMGDEDASAVADLLIDKSIKVSMELQNRAETLLHNWVPKDGQGN